MKPRLKISGSPDLPEKKHSEPPASEARKETAPAKDGEKTGVGEASETAIEIPRKAVPKSPKARGAKPEVSSQGRGFPIVGVGASAGGLEALSELFEKMPPQTGMGFVVVTHQHPGHTSMMPELLRNKTSIPISEAGEGVKVQPDHIYISPPGCQLDILNGTLLCGASDKSEAPHLPIDHFLRSLAVDQRERAICIILSGTGSDGTLGLKAIKGESGMAMVQNVQSAKYGGMPASAISTGLADYVLRPPEMPRQLVAFIGGPYLTGPVLEPEGTESPAHPLQKILLLLRARSGHDFSKYKANTIRRRIERRMNVHQIKSPDQYVRFLQENPHELDLLFKELLISVTSFFRDPEAFEALNREAIPQLLKTRPDNYTIRGWSAGCATGEEAYSLAMLLREAIGSIRRPFEVQLFGTDLDHDAIEAARAGQYSDGIVVDLLPPRLEQYFLREDGGYRIRKDVREMVVFAVQNIIKDPPFTKLDVISCRNLLIYLNADMQKKLIPLFHYSLKPGGLLFLGPSESIGGFNDLFEPVDKKWKIFRRKESPLASRALIEFPHEHLRFPPEHRDLSAPRPARETNVGTLVERVLLARYAPATVMVNDRGDIIFIHGRTGAFLEPSAGQPRWNIHEMAREGLHVELASAIRQSGSQSSEVVREGVKVRSNGGFIQVDLSVIRLVEPEAIRGFYLITFRQRAAQAERKRPDRGKRDVSREEGLERELRCTKESLQTTIEELETSNEELKSANEELQSTNEELQSTNEELETSKEEMQSLNEELTTVNSELQSKVEELSRANDDMQNLLNSTEIATIFLDRSLNITRYTQQARRLVNLIQSDVGRPLADLVSTLDFSKLVPDCREVLRTLAFKQTEAQTEDGKWFLMRIMPYRTADNLIDGLVLTFVDINRVKNAEQELAAANERLENDLEAMMRLQHIGALFVRRTPLPSILEVVLSTAIQIAQADMGSIQLRENGTGPLKTVVSRGFTQEGLQRSGDVNSIGGACAEALITGRQVVIENAESSPALAGSPDRDFDLKHEIRAVVSTPLKSRGDCVLGTISIHFHKPYRPDNRILRLLDILARQTAEFLESAEVTRSGDAGSSGRLKG